MPLIKRRNVRRSESLISVIATNRELIVVDSDSLIRVTDCEIEIETVMEVVVWIEAESVQISVGDVEFDGVWTEDEPEDKSGDSEDYGYSYEDVADQA
jgi:hypothetical protein